MKKKESNVRITKKVFPLFCSVMEYHFLALFSLFFPVPPDKPKIFDERGQEVRLKLGPYRIGDTVTLKCTAYGGMQR